MLTNMKVATRYSYKYLSDSAYVYVVTKQSRQVTVPLFSRKQCFLTQHFELASRKEKRHVVVGFSNEVMLQHRLPELVKEMRDWDALNKLEMIQDDGVDLSVHVTKLKDMKTHCALMTMPLIVYMNGYCDTREQALDYDVFFHEDGGHYRSTFFSSQ